MKSIIKKSSAAGAILLLLIIVSIVIFWEKLPIRLIWPYLNQQEISIGGSVEKITVTGENGGEQSFFVYLPKGYQNSDKEFPVLYHLHGAFARGSWVEYETKFLGNKVEQAVAGGIVEPMIIVSPLDPEGDRMWSDSFDGKHLVSTGILDDLIPYVDSNYRTINNRSGRAIQGFSMGGFGAVVNGFKAPEYFSAVLIWDGALHDWNTLSSNRKSIADKMFATEHYFDTSSPYAMTGTVAENDPALFMVVGNMEATRDFASRFKPHLESTGREFNYYDVDCAHNIFCIFDKLGDEGFKFLSKSFTRR
ncbi:MAG: esterase family protein [Alteromonadales bacterium]|nr:esterase family protein [Alteromonadales bacterium]